MRLSAALAATQRSDARYEAHVQVGAPACAGRLFVRASRAHLSLRGSASVQDALCGLRIWHSPCCACLT